MTHVKICGITNESDAQKASELGVSALGFVFYKQSARYISAEAANQIVRVLPPFVVPIALFVDATSSEVDAVIQSSARWQIQFHGNETDDFCKQFNRTYIKALRVQEGHDIRQDAQDYPSASAILLDTFKKGIPGGTGESFNWDLVPADMPKPVILAGGLTPENVSTAISTVQPYAVDVSGGVELSKGIKDHNKLALFLSGAKG